MIKRPIRIPVGTDVLVHGLCSPLSMSGKGNHVVRRLNLDTVHVNATEGSWQSVQKIVPHQLNNQQNDSPTQSPLCTGMNYSYIHEFGTAHFISYSFSLMPSTLQGYELIHGLRALRWRRSVPFNRREAITQQHGETAPKTCLCKMRKCLKPIIFFSAVSFPAGKEAAFLLHMPWTLSLSLSLSVSHVTHWQMG
jgi:hypothetical protein